MAWPRCYVLKHICAQRAVLLFVLQGSNSEFTYSIMETGVELPFAIDSNTGIITTDTLLDYEGTVTYTFTVSYRDNI